MSLVINKLLLPVRIVKTSNSGPLRYLDLDPLKDLVGEDTDSSLLVRYRWWWRYLNLCLELEKNELKISEKNIEVDKKFYEKWRLETMLSTQFGAWWRENKNIFIGQKISVLTKPDLERFRRGYTRSSDNEYVYLKVPKHIDEKDLLQQIGKNLLDQRKRAGRPFEFSKKSFPSIRHHIYFNCLILSLSGASRKEIMRWCNHHYRGFKLAVQTKTDKNGLLINRVFSYEQSVSRSLSRAKETLFLASKGSFG